MQFSEFSFILASNFQRCSRANLHSSIGRDILRSACQRYSFHATNLHLHLDHVFDLLAQNSLDIWKKNTKLHFVDWATSKKRRHTCHGPLRFEVMWLDDCPVKCSWFDFWHSFALTSWFGVLIALPKLTIPFYIDLKFIQSLNFVTSIDSNCKYCFFNFWFDFGQLIASLILNSAKKNKLISLKGKTSNTCNLFIKLFDQSVCRLADWLPTNKVQIKEKVEN